MIYGQMSTMIARNHNTIGMKTNVNLNNKTNLPNFIGPKKDFWNLLKNWAN